MNKLCYNIMLCLLSLFIKIIGLYNFRLGGECEKGINHHLWMSNECK